MWEYFGYAFYNPKNETNWTDLAIDLPLNNLTSTISFVCYAWVNALYFSVHDFPDWDSYNEREG